MKNIELEPCPFCNEKPEVIYHYIKGTANRKHCFVRCPQCKFRPTKYGYTYRKENDEKAITNWNRSVDDVWLQPLQEMKEDKEKMTYKLGTLIRATSHDGRVIIAGRYVSDVTNIHGGLEMVIEQSNGIFGFVRKELFTIEDLRPHRTGLELEMQELIELYRKEGKSDEYILLNIKKVWEDMRNPVKEIKGEMDT